MRTIRALRNQQGFALVSAIFIVVVLAVVGAFMLNMVGVQSRTGLFALQGARAYQAAQSGLEWGIYEVINNGCNPGSFTLEGFSVSVSCTDLGSFTEGSDTYNIYRLSSMAESGTYGTTDYVQRTVVADVTDL